MMDAQRMQTVLVTGYSTAPVGTCMQEVYRYCGVVLEVDPQTDRIVDADFSVLTDVARRFLRGIMIGYDLSDGLDGIIDELRRRYHAPAAPAMAVALRSAVQRYWASQQADGHSAPLAKKA